jgi:UDP-N-acetylglucosamine 4,6-dehydratase
MFNNKTILITGGTGSFGKGFLNFFIKNKIKVKKLIIFSRDELKQYEMSKEFSESRYPFIRYFLGDVRDKERLNTAFSGVDYVVHAAALKQVEAGEYNPIEFIKTNINGVSNIIETSMNNKVKKVLCLSTDKAVNPINLYGATKLCSERLLVSANLYSGNKVKFSVARYGNVMGSRGSVMPFFFQLLKKKKNFLITDKNMTRFNISISEAVKFTYNSLKSMMGGEIFIPLLPSYRITDLAKAISTSNKIDITGKKIGEKIHEELISNSEVMNTYYNKRKKTFVILAEHLSKLKKNYLNKGYKKKEKYESYNSRDNNYFLSINELKKVVKSSLDVF